MLNFYDEIELPTAKSFEVIDITKQVKQIVEKSALQEAIVTITSLHTTCALAVNENEERLLDDIRNYFLAIAPADKPYKHNDLHLRVNIPPDEPENAHAHLIAMMLGNSESVSVHQGELVLGRYQSILMLEMDGPRQRKCAVQLIGTQ
ncbi:MAG: secondary thiamine-phosphate synthase enzyme YjbQ [Candidatus Thiodiazotropha taylori]|nr:secondary thiamine-phosphate synthase enzyme YjbQ [Candidatus Thiodiazotropha taylori]MCG7918023.1 secondary thiamine-phosphate synthase enzyme YjbQ [Candidatus Thiodiazotropha taylori]MCG7997780.1 secondary thiamine-phosphate synthase enzyme YjbQ [Candidatus Thiodiazotropha taylori]MCG8083304.1 secondary thiamine-phosphate synthase enzyme YjbQ [Candidatus Thiodiazotropha taylori]MCW4244707.1 secondary thiamine-phosphate synthase enzyme YjbQ [Candidatus Thiodiazotropha taylori]